jgi:cytochrome c biogenesis protein ResB
MGKRGLGKRQPGALALALDWISRLLARMDVAAILILLVLLLAIVGSCFPQRSRSMTTDPDRLARWQGRVRARYGGATDFLRAVGAFQWFHSPAFWLAAGLLVLAVLVCTLRRWRSVWRRAFRRPVRCSSATFDRATHAAELHAPSAADLIIVVRESLEHRGFSVRSRVDGDFTCVRGDRNRLAPLATLLTHAALLALVVGVALTAVWRSREELTLRPGEAVVVGAGCEWSSRQASRSDDNSGLQVRNEGLTILRYADGSVAGYDAEVVLVEGGGDTMRGHIRLNQPLAHRGIAFTLQGYTAHGESYSVTLHAVRDPGYPLVVAAGLLMFLGLTLGFNLPHCCVHVRIEPEGVLRLAGRADRRAWGFGRQFAALVREMADGQTDRAVHQ